MVSQFISPYGYNSLIWRRKYGRYKDTLATLSTMDLILGLAHFMKSFDKETRASFGAGLLRRGSVLLYSVITLATSKGEGWKINVGACARRLLVERGHATGLIDADPQRALATRHDPAGLLGSLSMHEEPRNVWAN
jgi:hypothetical protein